MAVLGLGASKIDGVARATLGSNRWLTLLARLGYTLAAIAVVACHYDSRTIRSRAVHLSAGSWTRFNAVMRPSGARSEVCMLLPAGYRSKLGPGKEVLVTQVSTVRNMIITGRWIRDDGMIVLPNGWSLSQRHRERRDREQICLMLPTNDGTVYTAVEFRSSDSLSVSDIRWDSHDVFAL